MRLRIYFSIALLMAFFLYGCSENATDSIISLGTEMSAEEIQKINNLDKASYAELEGIVKDNSVIDPEGKYLMMIFGTNGCIYCDQLKKEIKNSPTIQAKLKESFSPYYINFSYIKPHQFLTQITSKPIVTSDLVQIYSIGPTPTTIFANQEGKTIVSYPGAISEKQFIATLDFITSETWKDAQNEKEIMQRLTRYIQEHQ